MCVINTTLIPVNLNSIPLNYSVTILIGRPLNCVAINLYVIQLDNIINVISAGLSHLVIVIIIASIASPHCYIIKLKPVIPNDSKSTGIGP